MPVWLDTPLAGLEVEDGRVTGVRVTRDGEPALIRARRGVLIATGGFERDEQMRRRYQRAPVGTEWTTGAAGNTGDGIRAGLDLGADTGLMDDAWWGPSIPLPGGPYFCLAERSLPGCVLVNGAGQRFVNESAPYVDAVHAMYDGNTPENPHIPAWLVFDQRYRDRYVFAGPAAAPAAARAAGTPPGRWSGRTTWPGWPARPGSTPTAWSRPWPGSTSSPRRAGTRTSAAATRRTTATTATRAWPTRTWPRWPGRRSTRSRSSPATWAPRAACAPTSGPGCCGPDGTVIEGLFAAGNASEAVMGHSYAGAGATIGPAMTFGYIAARTMAAAADGL